VRDIGEALVFKHVTDADDLPDDEKLAAIDRAIGILPAREQRSPSPDGARMGNLSAAPERP